MRKSIYLRRLGKWFIERTYLYDPQTGKLELAFPESLVPETTHYDLRYGNTRPLGKYRFLCTECKHRWSEGFNGGVCPNCGARIIVEKVEGRFEIVEKPIIGPVGDEIAYRDALEYMRRRGLPITLKEEKQEEAGKFWIKR